MMNMLIKKLENTEKALEAEKKQLKLCRESLEKTTQENRLFKQTLSINSRIYLIKNDKIL